jgi:Zinc finger, C2H2 type
MFICRTNACNTEISKPNMLCDYCTIKQDVSNVINDLFSQYDVYALTHQPTQHIHSINFDVNVNVDALPLQMPYMIPYMQNPTAAFIQPRPTISTIPNHSPHNQVNIGEDEITPAQPSDTSNQNKPFKCEEEGCDKSFKEKGNLNGHVRSVHQRERNHVCACGIGFFAKSGLTQHISNMHLKERPYRCDCGKSFGDIGTLNKHKTTLRHAQAQAQSRPSSPPSKRQRHN